MPRGKLINWTGLTDLLQDLFYRGYPTLAIDPQGKKRTVITSKGFPHWKQEELIRIFQKVFQCSRRQAWEKVKEIAQETPFRLEKAAPTPITLENSNQRHPKIYLIRPEETVDFTLYHNPYRFQDGQLSH